MNHPPFDPKNDLKKGAGDSGAEGRKPAHGSEWLAFRRCLALLQRLCAGPASHAELVAAVRERVGAEAYPHGDKALQSAFKRDRQKLRSQFEAVFRYDALQQVYTLEDAGPYGYIALSQASLQAVHLLSQTFAGEIGERVEILTLLDELLKRLSPEARQKLESAGMPIDLDAFQGVEGKPISARVWEMVQRAARERRKLAFNYLSPQHTDGSARYHEVAPNRIRFRGGHWYLHAYDLFWRNPSGEVGREAGFKSFRLVYIQDDEKLAVLPSMLPPGQRRLPRYVVHYRLFSVLSRGAISRHFDDMRVTRLPDGSVEVVGATDDEWEAARLLTGYGENCVVLGGPEVLKLVEERVRGLARVYGILVD